MRFGKTIMFLLFASLLLVLSACGDSNNDDSNNNANDNNNSEEASGKPEDMPEPDLENVPDVVAKVNGEEIPKKEFESVYKQQFQSAMIQSQMSGEEVDQDQLKSRLADSMIGQELILQEFNKNESELSEETIESTLQDAVEENGMDSKEALFDAIKKQDGLNKESFMEDIKTKAKIDHLVDKEAGDVEPSEEEIKETYEGLKKQQEKLGGGENADESKQSIPDYKEAKPRLKEQLIKQKRRKAQQDLVNTLRDDADITNNFS